MPRPETPASDHTGYSWRAVLAPDWRIHTRDMLCRRLVARVRCTTPAVADLLRSSYRSARGEGTWWAYCPEHMYGKWVEDGVVMEWRLREDREVPDAADA